jgi:hypothetical protein
MPGIVVRADDRHRALEERRPEELAARVETLEAALAEIAAHDPYPVEVFTPLTAHEEGAIREALRTSGVRHPLDRTYAAWGRHVGRQYAEMARRALLGEKA